MYKRNALVETQQLFEEARFPGALAQGLLYPGYIQAKATPTGNKMSGGTIMTISQAQALWELCRQGLPLSADEAERCWEQGQTYQLRVPVKLPWEVEGLIEQCNWEVSVATRAH